MIEFRRWYTYDGDLRSNIEDVVQELQELVIEQQKEINDLKAKLATTAEEANSAARATRRYAHSPKVSHKSKILDNMERMRNTLQFDDTNLPGMYE